MSTLDRMTEAEACVYFDQPGHVPEQKPDPRTAYAGGPDAWPMCGSCAAIAESAARPRPTEGRAASFRGAAFMRGAGGYTRATRTPRDLDPDSGTVWDLPRDAEYDDPDDPASGYADNETEA